MIKVNLIYLSIVLINFPSFDIILYPVFTHFNPL